MNYLKIIFSSRLPHYYKNACRILIAFIFTACTGPAVTAQADEVPFEIAPVHAPFEMPQMERPDFPDRTFDIRDYGATELDRSDEVKVTDAIHQAVEAANAAGGGKVLIPEGEWLTGPIHLMSNVNLHVAEGATVYFSEDREDYLPVVRQRHEGVEAYNHFETGDDAVVLKSGFNEEGLQINIPTENVVIRNFEAIEFGEGLSAEIIKEDRDPQAW